MLSRLLAIILTLSIVLIGCTNRPGSATPIASAPTTSASATATASDTPDPTSAPSATPTHEPETPTPTATSTATPAPTATPTPAAPQTEPAAQQVVNLGVPAGNTYLLQTAAVDAERGIAYALSQGGDANPTGGVLTVVHLPSGQIQASLALPFTPDYTAMAALSADGTRLYATGNQDSQPSLWVIATGVGDALLGQQLGSRPGVRAMALDPMANLLYVVEDGQVLSLDALSLHAQLSVPANDLASDPVVPFIALNPQAHQLYLSRPSSRSVAVYNTGNLSRLPDIPLEGNVYGLTAHPQLPQTYARTESFAGGQRIARVAILGEDVQPSYWDSDPDYQIGQVIVHPSTGSVLLLEDGFHQDATDSRIRLMNPHTGEGMEIIPLRYLNLNYGRAYTILGNTLYRLDTSIIPINLGKAEPGQPIRLEIRPVSAVLDAERGRLFVLDSAGTMHLLDPVTLEPQATWPDILHPGLEFVLRSELALIDGQLYVPDYQNKVTLVLDATSGEEVGIISRAGQITADPDHDRLFLTDQGVYLVNPDTYEITGSIPETVRQDPMLVVPGALRADYGPEFSLLFVTMTNNSPGSSNSSWLEVYDGETLTRLDSPIGTTRQFVNGLALNPQTSHVWVAGGFPGPDLTMFALDGEIVTRFQGLGGALYLDTDSERLYVSSWDGLVTVDTTTQEVIAYRPLDLGPVPGSILLFDPGQGILYAAPSNGGLLYAIDPTATVPPTQTAVGELPPQTVRGLVPDAQPSQAAAAEILAVVPPKDYGPSGLFIGQQSGPTGEEWTRWEGGLPEQDQPHIVAAPGQQGTLFAFADEDRYRYPWGLFRSTDGGRTWQSANRGLNEFGIRDIAFSPDFAEDGTVLLLAGEDSLYETRDGGLTWQLRAHVSGAQVAMARVHTNAPRFLVIGWNPNDNRESLVYAPAAEGDRVEIVGRLPETRYAYTPEQLTLSPSFTSDGIALVGMGQAGIFRSRDYGQTWEQTGPQPGPLYPYYTILFSPTWGLDATIYMLIRPYYSEPEYRGVLYRSTDAGRTWQEARDTEANIATLALSADGQLWVGDTTGQTYSLNPRMLDWRPIASVQPTPTPTPNAQRPTSVPPTATPRPGPPTNLYIPQGIFAELWEEPQVFEAIGWANEQQPHETAAAFQRFEGGGMIWRGDTTQVYALYDDGSWEQFDDTWSSDEPEWDTHIVSPAGRFQPKRGFGKVWREQAQVRERLGWALEEESARALFVQPFERGELIRLDGQDYVLLQTGNWWHP